MGGKSLFQKYKDKFDSLDLDDKIKEKLNYALEEYEEESTKLFEKSGVQKHKDKIIFGIGGLMFGFILGIILL